MHVFFGQTFGRLVNMTGCRCATKNGVFASGRKCKFNCRSIDGDFFSRAFTSLPSVSNVGVDPRCGERNISLNLYANFWDRTNKRYSRSQTSAFTVADLRGNGRTNEIRLHLTRTHGFPFSSTVSAHALVRTTDTKDESSSSIHFGQNGGSFSLLFDLRATVQLGSRDACSWDSLKSFFVFQVLVMKR